MSELQDKPVNDVEALLNELEEEEVPPMTAEFEADAMQRIARRKKELDEAENISHRGSASSGWKIWLAAAAVFIFLFGGTLLTRGSLHTDNNPSDPGTGKTSIVQPMSMDPLSIDQSEEEKIPQDQNQATLFFEDMWLFVKASLPWLGGAGALAVLLYLVRKKQK